jgi:hypothetical protein
MDVVVGGLRATRNQHGLVGADTSRNSYAEYFICRQENRNSYLKFKLIMKKYNSHLIYLISAGLAFLLGHAIYTYQPIQTRYEVAVKLGYVNGRPIDQPSDLASILKTSDNIREALGDEDDFKMFSNETGLDGAYDFQVQSVKGSDVVTLVIARKYFGSESPKFDSTNFLDRLARHLQKRHNDFLSSYMSEELQRRAKYQSGIQGGVIVLSNIDTYQSRTVVIGRPDVRKKRLFTRWLCYGLLLVIALGITHVTLHLRSRPIDGTM